MPPKNHNSTAIFNQRPAAWRRVLKSTLVATAAALYMAWFLTFPLLAGLNWPDGMPISRLQFLSRIMLPELWWAEMTGGGRLPLGILDRWPIVVGSVAWLGVAFVIGRPVVRLAFQGVSRVEAAALAMLAGLALLSTTTLLVGLAGGSASRWALTMPIVAMFAAAWVATWRIDQKYKNTSEFNATRADRILWLPPDATTAGVFGQLGGRLVVVLTLMLVVIYCLGAMMPPFEFDVVAYHLQSAKEFYTLGNIDYNDHNIYANMPLGLEMHSLAAMSLVGGADVRWAEGWWLGALIGKAIIGAHALIAAALVGGFVTRQLNSHWVGWSVAGLWLSVPGNVHVSTAGLIDSALSTYLLASLVGVSELWRRQSNATETVKPSLQWLVFAIFLYAGGAAAAKYPGLIYAVVPCLLGVFFGPSVGTCKTHLAARTKLWFLPLACGLSLTCVPWYTKNAVLTGNPVYPLAYDWFGGRGLDAARAGQWSAAHQVPIDAKTGSTYSLAALVNSAKQIVIASEFVQPSLLILAMCGLLSSSLPRGSPDKVRWQWAWIQCSLWIVCVWWFATHRIDRFWLPAVSLWAGVAGVGLAWLVTRVAYGLAIVLVLVGLAYGILVGASPMIGDNRYFVSLAALRADGGDEENVGRISPAMAWCNENLVEPNVNLLLVGEARVFDFKMNVFYSTCFDKSPAEKWLRGQSTEKQRAGLRAAGVTHVFVNWQELARYRSPGNYGFSDWPSREDLTKLLESKVLQRVEWPFSGESAELFTVAVGEVTAADKIESPASVSH